VTFCLHKSHIYSFDPRPYSVGHAVGRTNSERRRPVVFCAVPVVERIVDVAEGTELEPQAKTGS
jgi:hypothetical protein